MKTYYKIVEVKNNELFFLYHGVEKKRKIKTNKWLTAVERPVKDGRSYEYLSGFHFFPTIDIAKKYLGLFRKPRDLKIVEVKVQKIRQKNPNTEVLLASKIKFI